MKRAIAVLTVIILTLASSNQAAAAVAVIDAANLENSARQVAAWAEQLAEMRSQLEQARRQYEALTGSREFGEILYDPALRKYLPPEYQRVYDAASGGNYGISGSIAEISSAEKSTGSIADLQKNIEGRSACGAITDKAIGLRAYEGAARRLDQIEALMKQINNTKDLKAISELQARISVEQAAIQNEHAKLQIIGQLQAAEQKLIQEQKLEMSRRLLNNQNSEMPRIK